MVVFLKNNNMEKMASIFSNSLLGWQIISLLIQICLVFLFLKTLKFIFTKLFYKNNKS